MEQENMNVYLFNFNLKLKTFYLKSYLPERLKLRIILLLIVPDAYKIKEQTPTAEKGFLLAMFAYLHNLERIPHLKA